MTVHHCSKDHGPKIKITNYQFGAISHVNIVSTYI